MVKKIRHELTDEEFKTAMAKALGVKKVIYYYVENFHQNKHIFDVEE